MAAAAATTRTPLGVGERLQNRVEIARVAEVPQAASDFARLNRRLVVLVVVVLF